MTISSIFHLPEFARHQSAWSKRQIELAFRKAYYDGTIYRNVRDRFRDLGKLSAMVGPRLYRGTKALFLPLARAVDVDAGIIPGGWTFASDAPEAWTTAAKQIFAWSDWTIDGPLYVHYGAVFGLSGLKVADLRDARKVVIKPIDPTTFMLVRSGQYDATPKLALIIEQRTKDDGTPYEYAEVITPDTIRTFADGQAVSIDGRDAEYANDQGLVPVVEVRHLHTGELLGECTYQKTIPLLDEVNELASYLSDIVKKDAEAQWAVIGAEASDMVKSGDNVWFVPQGGDVKAMVAGIDIPGVLSFITKIEEQVHGALPELGFEELKSKTQIATATLELQLMELVLKIQRSRPNYDHGLADALRMAGRAGRAMGLTQIAALDDELLQLDAGRPVLPMDKETQLKLRQLEIAVEQQEAIGGISEAAPPVRQPTTDAPTDEPTATDEDTADAKR